MSSSTVRVIATFTARDGKADQLASLLHGLIKPTHEERGCKRYELWQNEANLNEFSFIEEWESPEALETHFATPHLRDALSKFPDLIAGELDLRKYRLVG